MVDTLPTWARDHLANFKAPKFVEIVNLLPTNAGGKVLKRELRERFNATQLQ
jgi:acyl-CoA synthetase (AMP-forming)/AMP-acid ligase II